MGSNNSPLINLTVRVDREMYDWLEEHVRAERARDPTIPMVRADVVRLALERYRAEHKRKWHADVQRS